MTIAAIDRLVHHAVIFELNVESYRRRAALERATSKRDTDSEHPKRTTEKGDLILSQICPSVSLSLDPETTHGHA